MQKMEWGRSPKTPEHWALMEEIRDDLTGDFIEFNGDRLLSVHLRDIAIPWILGAFEAGKKAAIDAQKG